MIDVKPDHDGNGVTAVINDLDLGETLDCGQAFRWIRTDENTYTGAFLDTPLTITQNGNSFYFHNTSLEEFENIWYDYFDLGTDYNDIKQRLLSDPTLAKACAFAGGIRLLRQDLWECLCSFIISQNNNIPRIKGIIKRLCEHYEHFPSAEELSLETVSSLDYLRAGFRAKYIIDASQKFSSGVVSLDILEKLDTDSARKQLMLIKGVGPKVADCVLLFGMHRTDAFPKDVWIKRVMEEYYPDGLPECTKGIEGIAQQYLFHYIRNLENT